MSKKNVYFYKLVLKERKTEKEIPFDGCKNILSSIINDACMNDSLELSYDRTEPVLMDVIENTDEYLFARLSRKRPNNSIQKRDYRTRKTTEVLAPDEIGNSGIECFTYCILGYSHGILSVVKSKGAPGPECFAMLFAMHTDDLAADYYGIPNNDIIMELVDGKAPQVNRVCFDIARPDPQIMEDMFGFSDDEILSAMSRKTTSLVVDVKPDLRGYLLDDPGLIKKLIEALRDNQKKYNTIKISGKKDGRGPQKEYDLYEEYFKYPVDIKEYRQECGRKIEVEKSTIQRDYRAKMMMVYDQYKTTLKLFGYKE